MPLLNKSLVPPRDPGVGDAVYGAPGGYRDSWAFVTSYKVADRIAAETGLSAEHAHRFLMAFGRVAQRLLFSGEPVGIPHLGVLCISETTRTIHLGGLIKHAKAMGVTKASNREGEVVRQRLPRLYISNRMRKVFYDNAVYTGTPEEHVAAARAHLKRRLKRHKYHSKDALKHTQDGPIMENDTPPEKKHKRRHMLVEDADAIVEADETGREHVQKTPDRKAEAVKRGVAESQL